MNLKTFNESFRKHYAEDIAPILEDFFSFETDLRNRLENIADQLTKQLPYFDVNAYARAFERCIEEMFPGLSWWEVTNCNIQDVLFNYNDPDANRAIDSIIRDLKPEFKDLHESVQFDETKIYVDTDGGLGKRGEKFTGRELKKYYDDNHNSDPVLNSYASFEDWFKDTSDNYLKEVEDEGCQVKLKESYDEPEMIGKGYSAPTSADFVKEVKSKIKYEAFEDLEDVQKRMQETSNKVDEFDTYWQAHKKAIMKCIKEAQDLIPVKYRK